MAKNLVIVESPAKAKTINKLLGSGFIVKASMGHVRDLPERSLGVDVEKGFAPQYVPIKGRAKILAELQAAAAKADTVYLAPDPDREGEAIAWHLREALQGKAPADKFRRVTYNEITTAAIHKAFEHPGEINQRRVDSQQARRILDRVVGYKVSPMLWRRIPGASSAGRVQSVALRLVAERELAIRNFLPEPYWILGVKAAKRVDPRAPFTAHLARLNGAKAEVKDEALALRLVAELQRRELRVADVIAKEVRKNAPPPFITSSLQQAASGALGFSPSRTMRIAQKLYEGVDLGHGSASGLITYMRTDSFAVAQEARDQAREFILKTHGPDFLPATPNVFRSRSSAQEAHEAIRPTDPARTPESLKDILERDDWRLYDLIWRRFMASQMAPARIAQRTAEIEAVGGPEAGPDSFLFRATASALVFPGFMRVSGLEQRKKEEAENDEGDEVEELPPLEKGEGLDPVEWLNDRKETQPPPRFTEASLVKVLEENGVGRPSTYAQIISTLLDRKYVDREKRALVPSELGMKVFDFLMANLAPLFDVQFTAGMEEQLDRIEEGNVAWTEMLGAFYEKFKDWMGAARGPAADAGAVEKMLAALAIVKEWQPPVKRGVKTVYSDEKFVESIQRQFAEKKHPISARQQEALAKLVFRYKDQLAHAEDLIRDLQLSEPPGDAEQRQPPRQETIAKLALLEKVTFDPPRKFGKKVYDDREFCGSLRGQVEGGKRLSPAQIGYLDKILRKYAAQIPDFAQQQEALGLTEEPVAAEGNLEGILALFETVREWKPPATRKGRTWDDRDFLNSLKTQYGQRKQLSYKQVSALKRLAVAYAAQIPDYAAAMQQFGLPEPRAPKKRADADRRPGIGAAKRGEPAHGSAEKWAPARRPAPGGAGAAGRPARAGGAGSGGRSGRGAVRAASAGGAQRLGAHRGCLFVGSSAVLRPNVGGRGPAAFSLEIAGPVCRAPVSGLVSKGGAGPRHRQPQDVEPALVLPLPGAGRPGEGQSI
jgi:DNA topoisomerase I